MISRAHGLILSLLLGAASAVGAYAVIGTAHLGDAQTKPEVVSSEKIAARARKLDAWEVSLQKTLDARPPALPPLRRYPAVRFVEAPPSTSLPTPVGRQAAPQSSATPIRVARETTLKPTQAATGHPAAGSKPRDGEDANSTIPARDTGAESETRAAATLPVTPQAAVPASSGTSAAPAQAPVTQVPTTLSVEQQCRQLLRAAEGLSEAVKQDAERRCEALKQAAEGRE